MRRPLLILPLALSLTACSGLRNPRAASSATAAPAAVAAETPVVAAEPVAAPASKGFFKGLRSGRTEAEPVAVVETKAVVAAEPVAPATEPVSAVPASGRGLRSDRSSEASHSSAARGPVFSWEKKDGQVEAAGEVPAAAPADVNKARVVSFNEKLGLISLMRSTRADIGSRLQLSKGEQALQVEVLAADDRITVVGITPNQVTVLHFRPDEEVGCNPVASSK